jgi:hypothetical protein
MTAREIVIVLSEDYQPDLTGNQLFAATSLSQAGGALNVELRPVFDLPPAEPGAAVVFHRAHRTAMRRFFRAVVDDAELPRVLERIRAMPGVSAAYAPPPVERPLTPFRERLANAAPRIARAKGHNRIPSFAEWQHYHFEAPAGVDSAAAWAVAGGRGAGVEIIDIEGGWCLTHRDLHGNRGLRGGQASTDRAERNHGTAVLGIIGGQENGFGVTGLAPAARFGAYSDFPDGPAGAIQRAADLLQSGDVLILEMHRPGPRHNFEPQEDQGGYIAVEWWPLEYAAIRYAASKGIIVVEAAGNGGEDLDDPLYTSPAPDFPGDWVNPFGGDADSGAIIVGAGAPPSGDLGPDRSRMNFSNYGSRIDCQGCGDQVTTMGYGDLYRGNGETEFYTYSFGGTSAASPIVAGAIACLQGAARARGAALDPTTVRRLLRETGSPQQAGPSAPVSQRIGTRPDLIALLANL